ncbi:hypothetical protein GCM10025859_67400 [Alicyclobacillus fastidiosus]|nr:hypothetical protein GCM10025859_67400 [Alicyclobacillus fastidiosus]
MQRNQVRVLGHVKADLGCPSKETISEAREPRPTDMAPEEIVNLYSISGRVGAAALTFP